MTISEREDVLLPQLDDPEMGDDESFVPIDPIPSRGPEKHPVEEFWRMPWQEFQVALGLETSMNLRNLNITTRDRAETFLRNCGFDITRPAHKRTFEQIFGEALHFIRHTLLTMEEREKYKVPRDILLMGDVRLLLQVSSERTPRKRYRRLWACALLKVMYAIANLEYSGKTQQIEHAREQIFGRIRRCLLTEDDKTFFQGKDTRVSLVQVDWKEAKTRASILLKLLHKPDSMVDEVFDLLGVRFVVSKESEIPQLFKLLIQNDVIIPHQVLGFRTRNALLNLTRGKRTLEFLMDLLSMDTVTPNEFREMSERVDWSFAPGESGKRSTNSFTSTYYRSLQLTVRHLVRSPNPAYLVVDSLSRQVRRFRGIDGEDDSVANLVPQELAHYFPLEIQIMDVDSYDLSRFGPASHELYKGNQLKTVRDRVLGSILKMTSEKLSTQEGFDL